MSSPLSTTKIISIITGLILLSGAAVWFWRGDSVEVGFRSKRNPTSENNQLPVTSNQTYTNETYGFSFGYPENFQITEIPEDLGTTILVQKPGVREGFQIFISEFDEPGPITAERIKQDLPEAVLESPQNVLIGEGKTINALIFFGEDSVIGKSREVWFVWPEDPRVSGNYLYQITTYPDMDSLIGTVLDTLSFR